MCVLPLLFSNSLHGEVLSYLYQVMILCTWWWFSQWSFLPSHFSNLHSFSNSQSAPVSPLMGCLPHLCQPSFIHKDKALSTFPCRHLALAVCGPHSQIISEIVRFLSWSCFCNKTVSSLTVIPTSCPQGFHEHYFTWNSSIPQGPREGILPPHSLLPSPLEIKVLRLRESQ